jgi:hypothetical protein
MYYFGDLLYCICQRLDLIVFFLIPMFYRFLCSITDRFPKLMSDNQKYRSINNSQSDRPPIVCFKNLQQEQGDNNNMITSNSSNLNNSRYSSNCTEVNNSRDARNVGNTRRKNREGNNSRYSSHSRDRSTAGMTERVETPAAKGLSTVGTPATVGTPTRAGTQKR